MWDLLLALLKQLRKLWAMLGNLLPEVRLPAGLRSRLEALAARPGFRRAITWLAEWRLIRALRLVWQRFLWRDYSGDRVKLAELPEDVAAPLRTGLVFAGVALLALLYTTRFRFPAISADPSVSVIALYLAVLGLALGLAGLLAGAARANLPLFILVLVYTLFLTAGLSGGVGGRGLHGLLGLAPAALALGQAGPFVRERRLVTLVLRVGLAFFGGVVVWRTSWLGLLGEPWLGLSGLALAAGALLLAARAPLEPGRDPRGLRRAALELSVLVLLYAALRSLLVLGPPFLAGAGRLPPVPHLLGVAALSAAIHVVLERLAAPRPLPGRRLFAGCAGLLLLYLVSLGVHRGHAGLLQGVDLALSYVGGSLWLVWYFLAVGIAYKLIKESRTLVDALEVLAPGRWLPAAGLLILLAGLALSFGGPLLELGLGGGLPAALGLALARFGLWVEKLPFVWYQTVLGLRPVLCAAALIILYLALRRRLERGHLLTVGFLVLLALLATYEYHFEAYGFLRGAEKGPRPSLLFFFSVWVIWLVYSVGMRNASAESPRFPREARTALFVGLLCLIVAGLHLQAVLRPRALADQIYFDFFTGLLNLGLPYFLYVYLTRRHPKDAVPVTWMAGAFLLGAALSLPAALQAKLELAGWDPQALVALVERVRESVLAHGRPPTDLAFPAAVAPWLLRVGVEEALKLAALAGLLLALRRRPDLSSAVAPILAVAVGTGLGAAAIMTPWLPLLPPGAVAALFPLEVFRELEPRLLLHHLSHLLGALLLAWALLLADRRRALTAGALLLAGGLAFAARSLVAALDHLHRAWLLSTGLDTVLLLVLALACLSLLLGLERRLAPTLDAGAEPVSPPVEPLVPASHRRLSLTLGALLLLGAGALLAHRGRLLAVEAGPLRLAHPATWSRLSSPGLLLHLERVPRAGDRLQVLIGLDADRPGESLAAIGAGMEGRLRSRVSDLQVASRSTLTLGGLPALRASFRGTLPGGVIPSGIDQVVLRHPRGLLVITYLAPLPLHAAYLPDFDRLLSSI